MASKQLYQLVSKHQLNVGAYVAVNGPWDSHGIVQKSEPYKDGGYLNLIRGCEPRKGERVVASF